MRLLPRKAAHEALRPKAAYGMLFSLAFAALSVAADRVEPHNVTAIRFWSLNGVTRVAVESDGEFSVRYDHLENPDRLFFDLEGAKPKLGAKGMTTIPVTDPLVKQIRVAETQHGVTRVVLDLSRTVEATTSRLDNPNRLIIELRPGGPQLATSVITPGPNDIDGVKTASKPPIEAEVVEPVKAYRPFRAPAPRPKVDGTPRLVQIAAFDPPPHLTAQYSSPSGTANALPKLAPPPAPVRVQPAAVLAKVPSPTPSFSISPPPPIVAPPAPAAMRDSTLPSPAKRDSTGERSMSRVLGLKIGRVVIDPGHGGHDTGTNGPEGLREKDLVLDIATRLGALIEERMNSEVIYTRTDDTFVPLEQRTEIANQAKADLFLSIHANSSPLRSATGVETYYLNFTTSKAALDVAARENAGSQKGIFELQDLLEKIALKDKVDESREFATRVQSALFAFSNKNDTRPRDRGVRKAPFVVLIGASMPSVLAEVGFISNPHEESVMKRAEYRQRLAEALYKGVSSYAATLSHFQVAQKR